MDYLYEDVIDCLCNRAICRSDISIEYIDKNVRDCFGVFVSVKVNGEIHSCLGTWYDYIIGSKEIYDTIIKLCLSIARGYDKRSRKFDKINLSETDIEIYFMKKIENDNVKLDNNIFDNETYGIIITCKNYDCIKRATYLPKVYGKIEWSVIKSSLMEKANADIDDNIEYMTYISYIIKKTFFGLVL